MTLGEGHGKLLHTIRDIVSGGQRRVLVSLGGVDYIDSHGLDELVSCYTTARDCGAELKLVNIPEKVNYLMHITKLDTVFEIFNDESAAVMSFAS